MVTTKPLAAYWKLAIGLSGLMTRSSSGEAYMRTAPETRPAREVRPALIQPAMWPVVVGLALGVSDMCASSVTKGALWVASKIRKDGVRRRERFSGLGTT